MLPPPSPRRFPLVVGMTMIFVGLTAVPAGAQLRLNVELASTRYLLYEPIELKLTIENNSGNELVFDYGASTQAYVAVFCRDIKRDNPVRQIINRGKDDALRLAPGQRRVLTILLNSLFSLQNEGDFETYVQIGHPRLPNDFRSPRLDFEVREGHELWGANIGLPSNTLVSDDSPIRTRRASVLWFSGAKVDHYALQIEDSERVYAIHRMGQRISSDPPVCQVDARSNIHVLLRLSSRIYAYRVYDYRGRLLQIKMLTMNDGEGPPVLIRDTETGMVKSMGGRIARPGIDYELQDDGDGRR